MSWFVIVFEGQSSRSQHHRVDLILCREFWWCCCHFYLLLARSPEPSFISVPAVTMATAAPAMVAMPTMVPAPAPAPSAISTEGASQTFLPVAEPTPEKSKAGFAAVKSGKLVMAQLWLFSCFLLSLFWSSFVCQYWCLRPVSTSCHTAVTVPTTNVNYRTELNWADDILTCCIRHRGVSGQCHSQSSGIISRCYCYAFHLFRLLYPGLRCQWSVNFADMCIVYT